MTSYCSERDGRSLTMDSFGYQSPRRRVHRRFHLPPSPFPCSFILVAQFVEHVRQDGPLTFGQSTERIRQGAQAVSGTRFPVRDTVRSTVRRGGIAQVMGIRHVMRFRFLTGSQEVDGSIPFISTIRALEASGLRT